MREERWWWWWEPCREKKKNQQGRERERGTDCSYLDRVNWQVVVILSGQPTKPLYIPVSFSDGLSHGSQRGCCSCELVSWSLGCYDQAFLHVAVSQAEVRSERQWEKLKSVFTLSEEMGAGSQKLTPSKWKIMSKIYLLLHPKVCGWICNLLSEYSLTGIVRFCNSDPSLNFKECL